MLCTKGLDRVPVFLSNRRWDLNLVCVLMWINPFIPWKYGHAANNLRLSSSFQRIQVWRNRHSCVYILLHTLTAHIAHTQAAFLYLPAINRGQRITVDHRGSLQVHAHAQILFGNSFYPETEKLKNRYLEMLWLFLGAESGSRIDAFKWPSLSFLGECG